MKRKPIRFKEIMTGDSRETRRVRDEVEEKPYKVIDRWSRHGRTTIGIECPFCLSYIRAYVWSLCGGGKRCGCGALFGSFGNAYRWKP